MKFFTLLFFCGVMASSLHAQYVCTPCNLACDTLSFATAGDCPHCNMPLIAAAGGAKATKPGEDDVGTLIKWEAERSRRVMRTVSQLADVYGPRLMGTPNYYKSVLWLKEELESYGLTNVQLPSFDDGHVGWTVESFGVRSLGPVPFPVSAYPLAYTPSTEGTATGEVLPINGYESVYALADSLEGKVLMLRHLYRPNQSITQIAPPHFSDSLLAQVAANEDPNDRLIGYHSRRPTVDVFGYRERRKRARAKFLAFCKAQGVVAILEPSNSPYGILHADGNNSLPSYDRADDPRPLPTFVIANEHFGRLLRLHAMGHRSQLEVELATTFHHRPEYNINLIADLPGSDPLLKDEYVIIGAHLDSWHAGTGAVDNAANCAVMLEAIRLLKAFAPDHKRTIRLALWGGEEQVFAGSRAYVTEHIGDFTTGKTKSQQPKIAAYLNLDNGAGKIRGLYLMGNRSITARFADHLADYPNSQTLTQQNANQTDHELFDYFNVPAFQFIQDPLDYIQVVHHTNMDGYEYVQEADQQYNAGLVANLALRIANDERATVRKDFNNPVPSRAGKVTVRYQGTGEKVYLIGDFNNWNMFGTPLYPTGPDGWEVKLDLPPGNYLYKFIVDGEWHSDPSTPATELLKDGKGHGGLTRLVVK